jgi:O-antigen biosynthesis protein
MLTQGMRNVCLPHVVLYHYESKSRGYDTAPEKQVRFLKESDYMKGKWEAIISRDPCYNPNLTLRHENWQIREYEETENIKLKVQVQQTQNKIEQLQAEVEQITVERLKAIEHTKAVEPSKSWRLRKSGSASEQPFNVKE